LEQSAAKTAARKEVMHLDSASGRIFAGNLCLAVCCLFYLAWWCAAFRPENLSGETAGTGVFGSAPGSTAVLSAVLFLALLLSGITGLYFVISGMKKAEAAKQLLSPAGIVIGCIAAYLCLLAVTRFVFHRQVTTELILIVGWVMLELLEVNTLYGCNTLGKPAVILLFCVTAAAAAGSFIAYMCYYKLAPKSAYIDGMVPLILIGAVFAITAVLQAM